MTVIIYRKYLRSKHYFVEGQLETYFISALTNPFQLEKCAIPSRQHPWPPASTYTISTWILSSTRRTPASSSTSTSWCTWTSSASSTTTAGSNRTRTTPRRLKASTRHSPPTVNSISQTNSRNNAIFIYEPNYIQRLRNVSSSKTHHLNVTYI